MKVVRLSEDDKLVVQGIFDSGSLILAVVGGIWEAGLFKDNPYLLFEIEAAISVPVLFSFYFLAKYRKKVAFTFAKLLLKGLTWVTALFSGNLFTTGYGYLSSFPWPYGPLWLAIYFLVVAWILYQIKIREHRLDIRRKEWERAQHLGWCPLSS